MAKDTIIKKRQAMKAGERYSRLISIEFVRREEKRYFWRWRCDCETEIVARADSVRDGHI